MAQKKSGPLFFKAAASKPKGNASQRVVTELAIERLSSEGRGMAFENGKPIFVATALPGERVRARIYNDKREFAEAELLEIIHAAPQRRQPPCALFGHCGGCQLQMLDDADQLAHKEKTLRHGLQAFIANGRVAWKSSITASSLHYRHRARLAVAEQNGKPVVGFKAANSHRVLAVANCSVLDLRLQPILRMLPEWLEQLPQWRRIDELLLSVDSAGRVALAWRTQRAFPKTDADTLTVLCRSHDVVCGSDAQLTYAVPSQGTAIAFIPGDFTQINPAINDQLATRVIDWLAPTPVDDIADFFCGLGNFTLPIARHSRTVTGYEVSPAMVARAQVNALENRCQNVSFQVLDLFEPNIDLGALPNKALLDPPRAGAKALCEKLARLKSLQRIVYVSCNPQTLARDIGILASGGFEVRQAALVDMFPQTGHSEAIVCVERGFNSAK